MSIYQYFKRTPDGCKSELPSPFGPLSTKVPSSSIEAANRHVRDVLTMTEHSRRGTYQKYTAKDKAKIAEYAIHHGTSATVRHFSKEFPELKRSTVNDWKGALVKLNQHNRSRGVEKPVLELEGKQWGRPSTLSPE